MLYEKPQKISGRKKNQKMAPAQATDPVLVHKLSCTWHEKLFHSDFIRMSQSDSNLWHPIHYGLIFLHHPANKAISGNIMSTLMCLALCFFFSLTNKVLMSEVHLRLQNMLQSLNLFVTGMSVFPKQRVAFQVCSGAFTITQTSKSLYMIGEVLSFSPLRALEAAQIL